MGRICNAAFARRFFGETRQGPVLACSLEEQFMSIRKRSWKNARGEDKTAWVVDYIDQGGRRRLKTFERKKDADGFSATAKVEINVGIHTADSSSITVAEAGERWLAACVNAGLERTTVDTYRQHVNLHII